MTDPADLTTLANVKQWLGLTGLAISGISQANPAVVTLQTRPQVPLLSGQDYQIEGVTGMVELPAAAYTITVLSPTTFSIPVDSTLYTTYAGGGVVSITDPFLQRLITSCSVYFQSALNRIIRTQTYTENRNGPGGPALPTQQYPITGVTSVTVNGVTMPPRPAFGAGATTGFYGSGAQRGYVFDDSTIYLSGAVFDPGFQNVTVVYDAGYATTPADIEQAVIDLIGDWFKYTDRIGKTSQAIEGQSTSFVNVPMPVRSRDIFNQYRKVVPVGP